MSRRRRKSNTTPETDRHFIQMMEWLAQESRAEAEAVAARRKRRSPREAEKSGETLIDLAIADSRPGLGGRHLITLVKRNRDLPMPWHRLRVGSPIVLSDFPDDDQVSISGVISGRTSESIEVAVDLWPDGRVFRVDLTADEITRQRQLAAIQVAKDSRGRLGHLRSVLLGQVVPSFRERQPVELSQTLNESQRAAVEFALSAEEVAIIHGPPGTGKTTTAVELIIQCVRAGEKVLACAPSNTAVDNLLEKLVAAGQQVVRVGHPARVAEQLRRFTLDGLVESSDAMPVIQSMLREAESLFRKLDRYTRAKPAKGQKSEMRREAKRLKHDAKLLQQSTAAHLLERADIICATTSFNEETMGELWFDTAVIDEAAQSTEPGCWVPLLRCERVILAGDPQQLPPTVVSREAARQGFETSMLERVDGLWHEQITQMLTTQYRMHERIMRFSSDCFYEGRLVADESVRDHTLVGLPGVQDNAMTRTPVTFIDTAGAGWDEEQEQDGESRLNPQEAGLILEKTAELLASGVPAADIAVIAPYAAQVRLLRANTPDRNIEIDTVDGFQGREKEAVLITTVRSNEQGEIGFLGDQRRMNVALTRAKRKLIVVGDSATLGGHDFYRSLLEYFDSIGAYRSVWEEM